MGCRLWQRLLPLARAPLEYAAENCDEEDPGRQMAAEVCLSESTPCGGGGKRLLNPVVVEGNAF